MDLRDLKVEMEEQSECYLNPNIIMRWFEAIVDKLIELEEFKQTIINEITKMNLLIGGNTGKTEGLLERIKKLEEEKSNDS